MSRLGVIILAGIIFLGGIFVFTRSEAQDISPTEGSNVKSTFFNGIANPITVKLGPTILVGVHCDNSDTNPAYLQFLDSYIPSLGNGISAEIAVEPTAVGGFMVPNGGVQFQSGLNIGASTTAGGGGPLPGSTLHCTVFYK